MKEIKLYERRTGKVKVTDELVHQKFLEIKSKETSQTATEEYMNDSHHFPDQKSDPQISIDQYYLDFGSSKVDPNDEEFNGQKSVTLTNRTKGKILIFWNSSENQSFAILPVKCEIPPLKSYSFKVEYTS